MDWWKDCHCIFWFWTFLQKNQNSNAQLYRTGAEAQSKQCTKTENLQLVQVRTVWQYGLWSFQTGGTKLERFLPKNQHTQRKLLNFENWVNGEVSKSAKSPNLLTFKVNFLASIFKSLYLIKWCSIFDTSPSTQFSKFNSFLWVCWFLGKNLSNFVSPV